jgi:hypothetical protein
MGVFLSSDIIVTGKVVAGKVDDAAAVRFRSGLSVVVGEQPRADQEADALG